MFCMHNMIRCYICCTLCYYFATDLYPVLSLYIVLLFCNRSVPCTVFANDVVFAVLPVEVFVKGATIPFGAMY
jgi:hypothetical protein